jgi:hypothetical protein
VTIVENTMYSPQLAEAFVKKLGAIAPLWSGILLPKLGFSCNRISNANAENYMNVVQNDFQNSIVNNSVGRFIENQEKRVPSLAKSVKLAIPFQSRQTKKRQFHDEEDDENTMENKPKRKRKGSVYFDTKKLGPLTVDDIKGKIDKLVEEKARASDDLDYDSPLQSEQWNKALELKMANKNEPHKRFFTQAPTMGQKNVNNDNENLHSPDEAYCEQKILSDILRLLQK